jgi:hypothetical protein
LQHQSGERAIFAYFADDFEAQTAAYALKQAGFTEVRVDRIGPNSTAGVSRRYKTSLSSLTMNNISTDMAYGPLLAAHPSSSGMSSSYDFPASSIVLTLVCPEDTSAQAIDILKQHGASV